MSPDQEDGELFQVPSGTDPAGLTPSDMDLLSPTSSQVGTGFQFEVDSRADVDPYLLPGFLRLGAANRRGLREVLLLQCSYRSHIVDHSRTTGSNLTGMMPTPCLVLNVLVK